MKARLDLLAAARLEGAVKRDADDGARVQRRKRRAMIGIVGTAASARGLVPLRRITATFSRSTAFSGVILSDVAGLHTGQRSHELRRCSVDRRAV
jgi:hypothetical protein